MLKIKKYKNKGVKNFKFATGNQSLVGIYHYLSRPRISQCMSTLECDIMIHNFCRIHKYSDTLTGSAIFVHRNWDDFKAFVRTKNRNL